MTEPAHRFHEKEQDIARRVMSREDADRLAVRHRACVAVAHQVHYCAEKRQSGILQAEGEIPFRVVHANATATIVDLEGNRVQPGVFRRIVRVSDKKSAVGLLLQK